jgi:hypothetical protein
VLSLTFQLLNPREKRPSTHCMGGRVGLLGVVAKTEIPATAENRIQPTHPISEIVRLMKLATINFKINCKSNRFCLLPTIHGDSSN